MNVLVIGSGGREHAICWKLSLSPQVDKIYCLPGNAGMAKTAQCLDTPANFEALSSLVKKEGIDLTIVGPELPLVDGVVDHFTSLGLKIFGPQAKAALIEGSKVMAKGFMQQHHIPTAKFEVFEDSKEAIKYVQQQKTPTVVKADGLAAGKGVSVCLTEDEAVLSIKRMMEELSFGPAGKRVVIEECLVGEEASIMAFTDGKTVIPMVSAQDHKRIFDDDKGPNTGGMGAYSPAPVVTEQMMARVKSEILEPTIKGLEEEGRKYVGVIYVGLMITREGPKVLEYNARFGDPETQVVLPRLKTDIVEIIQACLEGRLDSIELEWDNRAALCVVLASQGYPGEYPTGLEISGLDRASELKGVFLFHAGTRQRNGRLFTSGGRVLGVTALGENIQQAKDLAYLAAQRIHFHGLHYRSDIGHRALS